MVADETLSLLKRIWMEEDRRRVLNEDEYLCCLLARSYKPEMKEDCRRLEIAQKAGVGRRAIHRLDEQTYSEYSMRRDVENALQGLNLTEEDFDDLTVMYHEMITATSETLSERQHPEGTNPRTQTHMTKKGRKNVILSISAGCIILIAMLVLSGIHTDDLLSASEPENTEPVAEAPASATITDLEPLITSDNSE